METVETVLGNVRDDEALAAAMDEHHADGTLERVEIDAAERVKSRLRVTTDAGADLGIVADAPALRDGDVLVAEADRLVVLTFASREALAIDLPEDAAPATLVELGHRVGNQHWDLAVRDGTAYVPLDADLAIVEDVLDDALPADASTRVETVDGALFVEDDRESAAGATRPAGHDTDHDHTHGEDGHARSGDGGHDRAHGGAEHDHAHGGATHDHTHDGERHVHDGSDHDHASDDHRHDHATDSEQNNRATDAEEGETE